MADIFTPYDLILTRRSPDGLSFEEEVLQDLSSSVLVFDSSGSADTITMSLFTASYALTSSLSRQSETSSYSIYSVSASYSDNSISSSYSVTASYSDNSVSTSFAQSAISSSYSITSSHSENSTTSSYAVTASYVFPNSDDTDNYAFVCDTTTQTIALANTYQNVIWDTNIMLDGWTHIVGSERFTCTLTSKYLVTVNLNVKKTSGGAAKFATKAAFISGPEISGSYVGLDITSNGQDYELVNNFTINATSGQQLYILIAGTTTNLNISPSSTVGTQLLIPSAKIIIKKL